MCYSKLNSVSPNLHNLPDSSTLCETDDNCNYLDLDSHMQLVNDPYFLTLIQLNVRGMIGKLTGLSHLINNSVGQAKIDAMLLCETWLNQINYPKVKVPGYKLIGNIRSGRMGGGTGLLIHNSLWCRQRKDLELDAEIFEHTIVELKTDMKNILLVSGYRLPNTNASKFLKEYKECDKDLEKTKKS